MKHQTVILLVKYKNYTKIIQKPDSRFVRRCRPRSTPVSGGADVVRRLQAARRRRAAAAATGAVRHPAPTSRPAPTARAPSACGAATWSAASSRTRTSPRFRTDSVWSGRRCRQSVPVRHPPLPAVTWSRPPPRSRCRPVTCPRPCSRLRRCPS